MIFRLYIKVLYQTLNNTWLIVELLSFYLQWKVEQEILTLCFVMISLLEEDIFYDIIMNLLCIFTIDIIYEYFGDVISVIYLFWN